MMTRMDEAPLRPRLQLAAEHLMASDGRDVLNQFQAYLLRDVDSPGAAIAALLSLLSHAVSETLTTAHGPDADPPLMRAVVCALAHPEAPDADEWLATLPSDVADPVATELRRYDMAWSADMLEWELSLAMVLGWPELEIDISAPLGDWDVSDAQAVFSALLAVVTLKAWGLLA